MCSRFVHVTNEQMTLPAECNDEVYQIEDFR